MSNETSAVVEKIRKLMNLAGHASTNVNEAAAAAARAQKMLFDHKLSMADLEVSTGATGESVDTVNVDENTGLQLKWKSQLMGALAHGFYCRTICSKLPGIARLIVIGKTSDVQTVVYMYSYLIREIDRLCAEFCTGKGFAYANSFRVGAVVAIYSRMNDQRRAQEAGPVSETALAVINRGMTEVNAVVEKRWPKLRTTKGPRISKADAFVAGKKAGHSLQLTGGKAIGSSPERLTA